MRRIPWDALVDFAVGFFTRKGVAETNARYMAEIAVSTEAFGEHTHGLVILPHLDGLIGGQVDPRAEPRVVREAGAAALVEAEGTFGQLAMRLASDLARRKAREQGVALVAVRNATWLGALGVYLIPLAEQGFLAQIWAQTSTCKDCAPVGGIDPTFSTNPIALAFPGDRHPVVADFSTASVSMGKAMQLIRERRKAPARVFLDKQGFPSDDPHVMQDGGSILFMGGEVTGHKGYALSLWCEVMAVLAGGSANNPDVPTRQNFGLLVADRQAFAGAEYYDREMKRFLARVRSSRPRPGVEAIRLPGERGFRSLHDAREKGVPVEDHVLARLHDLARRYDLPSLCAP